MATGPAAGLPVASRYEEYLVLDAGPVELHFTSGASQAPGSASVHVSDAARLWKRLREREIAGVGPVEDKPYGVREFLVTDPDGNRMRVGSPSPRD